MYMEEEQYLIPQYMDYEGRIAAREVILFFHPNKNLL
jgi:hypothetical protein